jgi:hypothetical protein
MHTRVRKALGKLPLYFVENQGQLDARVAYYVQDRDTTAYFTSQGVTIALTGPAASPRPSDTGGHRAVSRPVGLRSDPDPEDARQRWAIKLDFVGARPEGRPRGQEATPAVVSYFKGRREQWKTGLRTYANLVYPNLWPGIDVVFAGTSARLKYAFLIHPGADLGGIGADIGRGIAVDASGGAYVTGFTGSGNFPTTLGAFQGTPGNGPGLFANDAFVTKLDPTGSTLVYSTFLGGSGQDDGFGVAVDGAGSAHVTGGTRSPNYPTTTGAFQGTISGTLDVFGSFPPDVFVTKLNDTGSALVYSTYLGGTGSDQGNGIAVDDAGSAYVTGTTDSPGFPTTAGAFQTTRGGTDAFVTKVNVTGNALVYSTYLGGGSGADNQTDAGNGIAVDAAGGAWVTGFTRSPTFPTTADAFQPALSGPGGCTDAFVTKLSASGNALVYSTYLGNGSPGVCPFTQGRGIAADGAGSAYVTGLTFSGFPTTPGALQPSNGGGADGFIAKFNVTPANQPPAAATGGPYNAGEGSTITLAGSGSDPEAQPLTFAWDLDNDGSFEAPGQNPTFSAAGRDGRSSQTVVLRVCDPQNACATDATVVTITNLQPTATFAATSPISEGSRSTLSLTNPQDPSSADVAAGFRYSFACDGLDATLASSYATAGTANSTTCAFGDNGSFVVAGRIFDKDDGFSTYLATVAVTNVPPRVGPISGPTSPVQVNATVLTGGSFADPGFFDTHTAVWSWGDGTASPGTVTESGGSGSVGGSHVYTAAGVHAVTLTVTDDDSGAGRAVSSIAVYNKIVFSSTRDGNAEIYTMNIDGTSPTRLTSHPATDVFPAWSPDGRRIAFTSNRDGDFEVYVMNADGTGLTQLTVNKRVDRWPAWSPDGTKIAFTSNQDKNFEIYTMNADGTGPTRLTTNRAADTEPTWSPDGAKIAFASKRDGNFEIYVMNTDGSGQTRLTMNAAAERFPAWSPNGTKIAFTSDRDGNFEIYSMNPSGAGQTRLTTNPAVDAEPAWSADGAKIAFASNRDGLSNLEIYVINADGTGPTRLTTNPAIDVSPHW